MSYSLRDAVQKRAANHESMTNMFGGHISSIYGRFITDDELLVELMRNIEQEDFEQYLLDVRSVFRRISLGLSDWRDGAA